MQVLYYIFIFVIGACFGSFLNVWVWRTRNKKSVIKGRSRCPSCKHVISWYDNVPIISFLVLKAKCRHCSCKISIKYPLVELATAIAFAFVFYLHGAVLSVDLIMNLFIVFILVFIFVYDLLYGEILDRITLPAIAIIFVISSLTGLRDPLDMLIGFVVGAGFFLLQFLISKGRWVGGGDVRLGALMGVILGLYHTILALFLAYIIGAIISVTLILMKKKKLSESTPFGTYLTVATFIVMFWGGMILKWYLGFLGL